MHVGIFVIMVLAHFLAIILAAGLELYWVSEWTYRNERCRGRACGKNHDDGVWNLVKAFYLSLLPWYQTVIIENLNHNSLTMLFADGFTCELDCGFQYCIQVDLGSNNSTSTAVGTTTSAASTTSSTTTISTGDGVTIPSPKQTGLKSTYDKSTFWSQGMLVPLLLVLPGSLFTFIYLEPCRWHWLC